MKILLLCIINALMLVAGQIMFKLGVKNKDLNNIIAIVKTIFSPIIFTALILYGFTTVLWLYILNKTDISFAYPIQSLALPTVLVLSTIIFNEQISISRWIGILIIYIGIVIAVR